MNDPINPKHYDGTACAQIGELLSGNSYQVLKYNWRLGKKDDPVIETGKSIWYLDREILIAGQGFRPTNPSCPDIFFMNLLRGVDDYVNDVAWRLINWNRAADIRGLQWLRETIVAKRAEFEEQASGQGTMRI